MTSKRTKALAIPDEVKRAVWDRDGGRCVCCGSRMASPNAHYIARSQGGLGIEQNVLTLCADCHRKYDQSVKRKELRAFFRGYLKKTYPGWDEAELIYKRE